MSNSIVREALVRSVTWRPVSLKASQESIVPKTARSARSGVAQQPLDLRPREVGIDHKSGPLPHQLLAPGRLQLLAAPGGTPVLPDQRPVDRLAACRVPGDHRLALVGDPDPVQLAAAQTGVGDRLGRDPPRHLPDLVRIVLDPARLRKVLLELRVGAPGDPPLLIEEEAGGPGRALVDCENHRR